MVLSAGMDGGNVKEHGAMHKILQQKTFGGDCKFKTYTGRCHGFVNRGDMDHPAVAKDVDDALGRAEEFLQRHLFTVFVTIFVCEESVWRAWILLWHFLAGIFFAVAVSETRAFAVVLSRGQLPPRAVVVLLVLLAAVSSFVCPRAFAVKACFVEVLPAPAPARLNMLVEGLRPELPSLPLYMVECISDENSVEPFVLVWEKPVP